METIWLTGSLISIIVYTLAFLSLYHLRQNRKKAYSKLEDFFEGGGLLSFIFCFLDSSLELREFFPPAIVCVTVSLFWPLALFGVILYYLFRTTFRKVSSVVKNIILNIVHEEEE